MKLRHIFAMAILPLLLAACLDEAKQGSKQIPEFQGDTGGDIGGNGGGGSAQGFTIGGSVAGLSGNLVLENNGEDDLELSEDGTFAFATALDNGDSYDVTVGAQPDGQTCPVRNGSGTVSGADVTDVTVECSDAGGNGGGGDVPLNPAALQSITVTPDSVSIDLDETRQFAAQGTYTDDSTANLTSSVTWSSTNESNATIDATGLATGVGGVVSPSPLSTKLPASAAQRR